MILKSVLIGLLVSETLGRFLLRELGYLRLPSQVQPTEQYKLFGSTVEETAYDAASSLVYVVGSGSRLLHVVDVSNPSDPKRLTSYEFKVGDGLPKDVEICGDILVVSLNADIEVFEGHIQFFDKYNPTTQKVKYRNRVTVGVQPASLAFTPNCKTLLVANEGAPGVDHLKRYVDPEGSISIISFDSSGNAIERFIDFNNFNLREDIRLPGHGIPTSLLPLRSTVGQELEPEYITAVDNTFAYVTFQENDAIARINIKAVAADQLVALPKKEWKNYQIDTSDKDGGVHLRSYPIFSHRLPDTIKSIKINKKTYLFTADEGKISHYTTAKHGFNFEPASRAHALATASRFDEIGLHNATLISQLTEDGRLGRLYVSQIDGISPFSGKIHEINTFGGRGFSVWDGATYKQLFDSGDHLEMTSSESYYTVFNTDIDNVAQSSPENLKDTASDNMGPKVNALDVAEDMGHNFLIVTTENTGMLYLYTFNTTVFGVDMFYEHIYRRGDQSELYSDSYLADNAGDGHICDVKIIKSTEHPLNQTLIMVASKATGSISMYRIDKDNNPSVPLN